MNGLESDTKQTTTRPASSIRVSNRVRTAYGCLPVTFAHSEGVSVVLHMLMPDGDTLIYHVDPNKEIEVVHGTD